MPASLPQTLRTRMETFAVPTDKRPEANDVYALAAPSDQWVPLLLRALLPQRPSFIYERLSTRNRNLEITYIGFGNTNTTGEVEAADALDGLRRCAQGHSLGMASGEVGLAFLSYEALTGTASDFVYIRPRFLIAIDYLRRTLTLSGDYHRHAQTIAQVLQDSAFRSAPKVPELDESLLGGWQEKPSLDEFVQSAAALQKAMSASRDAVGVVLSVQATREASDVDPLDAYLVLRSINPSTCMFFLENGDLVLWGATSLPIFKQEGARITAETDGATRPVDRQSDEWNPSAKEHAEYDLVVRRLRDDLASVTRPASLSWIADREKRRYFNLEHLFAEIQAQLAPNTDAIDVLRALAPHGAALGHSRETATRLIREFDLQPRGPYAGAIGIIANNQSADFATVIRAAWRIGSTVYTRAGAKIVAASDPGSEYRECLLKTLSLRRSLAIAPRLRRSSE